MQQKRREPARARTFGLYLAMSLVTLVACILAAEAMIRLLVPREVFWPISNIYHASEKPSVGYTFKRDFNGVAFGVDLRTNTLGFRGPEWKTTPPKGTIRIALIGDSHAFAYGVPFKQSVGEILAESVTARSGSACEVLNFAAPGYNSRQELAVLREYALGFQPDIVLIVMCSNDHDDALTVGPDGWMVNRKDVSAENRIHDKSINKTRIVPVSWWKHSRIVLYLKLVEKRREFAAESNREDRPVIKGGRVRRGRNRTLGGPIAEPLVKAVFEPVQEMIALSREQGARVVVTLVGGTANYRKILRILGETEKVPTLELNALLPDTPSSEAFKARFSLGWDSHRNAVAHEFWGVGLARFLEKSGALAQREPRSSTGRGQQNERPHQSSERDSFRQSLRHGAGGMYL